MYHKSHEQFNENENENEISLKFISLKPQNPLDGARAKHAFLASNETKRPRGP